ncbi:MAG: hypothetical protein KBA71_14685 [Opitutaceae bacterium]|nr:hypothetical protein [Opitutaceae bacterium]
MPDESSLLLGAIDTHVHSAPDVIPRKLDDLELVEQARRSGMRAVVLKNHSCSTCARAYLLNRLQDDVAVFGGIVLNDTIGGFNCRAVETSLKMGGSIVWMPTKSAANHQHFFGGRNGLTVLKGTGLCETVRDVIRMVADAGAILATGHLSAAESSVVIEEALAAGVRCISVTHPEWGATAMPVEMQQRFSKSGRVFFERCLVSAQAGAAQSVAFDTIVSQIRAVGVETTIAATDYGLPETLSPSDAMRAYIQKLGDAGFSELEIRRMVQENPAKLLQLN